MKYRLILFAALLAAACTPQEGLTIRTEDGTQVRLLAVREDVIRVSAVPAGTGFSNSESLCVVPSDETVYYSITRTDSTSSLSTCLLTATVCHKDGRVIFTDAQGRLLTSEHERSFSPFTADGKKAWTVSQSFDSPSDEAFWGLGQHQAGEWNYKGRNEELYQYNTKIAVPFIVSSRGYGVLWDSYSFCRWGDTRDYSQLGDVFTLYDKDGSQGALTGTYTPVSGETLVRRETALNQEYLIEPDLVKVIGAPEGFDFQNSHVTYDGYLEAPESGVYRFLLYYSGYHKVLMDGQEVVPEIWRTAWNPNSYKFQLEMKAGEKVPVHLEWDPDGSVAYCALKVLSPVSDEQQERMSWWGEMQDQLDYYFVAGGSPDGVIRGYRSLTGEAPIMPRWAMGYWQCRERYRSQDELVGTLSEMRRRHIPVDNIVQDWQYWEDDKWGSHEFDGTRYPDPQAMVDSIHSMGGRLMISVWPKFYTGTEHFDELDKKGWIYQTAVRDSVEDWLGYQQSFYDAYSEGARKLFWKQMEEHLFCYGIDAWWMDASEPNIHDCTNMDYRKAMCGPTALGPSAQYFNAYGLMNAKAIWEGQRASAPDQRVFLLTRSGFSGLQRYSTASWSGDIGTRWEDMRTQISAGLNYAMSGIPYWTQDVGGFSVENRYVAATEIYNRTGAENADLKEWRELQTRWHQMGMFNPLYRSHGQYPFREAWNIAPEGSPTYNAILRCGQMRYALMPYIYSLDASVCFDAYTIMRPLAMDWVDDPIARNCSDQFMFGGAIMVCPVTEYGARSREVYLPDGIWYDANDNFRCVGEGRRSIKADAPYDNIPVYARGGQIVVTGPAIEFTAQEQDGSLCIYAFTGADASFTLYEDDGVSYAYERGECSRIPIMWEEATSVLTVGERQGEFPGMFAERNVKLRVVSPDGIEEREFRYDGNQVCTLVKPFPSRLELATVFSDGVVLQQNSKAAIWGKAKPGTVVNVRGSWGASASCKTDSEGSWRLHLNTPGASYQAREIVVSAGSEVKKISDVLIGEVWFASGQSNMQMPMRGFTSCPVADAQKFITAAPADNKIRMFSAQCLRSYVPLDDVHGSWKGANPQNIGEMSATAFFYARKLNEVLDLPVGIVLCAYGGTRVESWTPEWMLREYEDEDLSPAAIEAMIHWSRPYLMYNAMLAPLKGYTVKGFIWYQGCSNVDKYYQYADRLVKMVAHWRELWDDSESELPFYQVEIAPFTYGDYEDESGFHSPSSELRKAQHEAALSIPNCACICTNDLVMDYEATNIHPCTKQPVGERLAALALNRDYGFTGIHCYSPELVSARVVGDEIVVKLSGIDWEGLDRYEEIRGLEVKDAKGQWHQITSAMFQSSDQCLHIPFGLTPVPVEVRYGWGDYRPGNLHSVFGLPVVPFDVKF